MTSFNVHEAKTHFSKILARVQSGEEVVIAKAGRPIAKVVPIRSPTKRVPGRWSDRIWVADDFDAPLPSDLLDAFEGRPQGCCSTPTSSRGGPRIRIASARRRRS